MRVLKKFDFQQFGRQGGFASKHDWTTLLSGEPVVLEPSECAGKYFSNALRIKAKKEEKCVRYNYIGPDAKGQFGQHSPILPKREEGCGMVVQAFAIKDNGEA